MEVQAEIPEAPASLVWWVDSPLLLQVLASYPFAVPLLKACRDPSFILAQVDSVSIDKFNYSNCMVSVRDRGGMVHSLNEMCVFYTNHKQ